MSKPIAEKKISKYLSSLLLLLAPLTIIVSYSLGEAIHAIYAAEALPVTAFAQEPKDLSEAFAIKRNIQKHFLNHGIYLPTDDIVVELATDQTFEPDRLTFLMRKACGKAKIYVWLPLAFKLPFKGRSVYPWCWTPH